MNSMLRVFPDLGYTLVVLSNYDSGANVAGTHISEMIRPPQRRNAPGPSAMVPQRAVKERSNGF